MSIQEVRVTNHTGLPDPAGGGLLYEIRHALGIAGIDTVRTAKVYRFEGIGPEQARVLAERLLSEEVFQTYSLNGPVLEDTGTLVEVAYKPGVMNPEAASLLKAASDLGVTGLLAADSGREYAFRGPGATPENIKLIVDKLLVNATVERVVTEKPDTLIIQGSAGGTRIVPINRMDDRQLMELSRDKLFLNQEEMRAVQKYFRAAGKEPTDCEIETIAQTWSEHCGHKTFRATLVVNGEEKEPLLKRLQRATREAGHPLVLSAFVDNSGVVEFYHGQAICGKVETHNSPSAIEPYGGAMTGSGGVFRDIMGTGAGARVIASTDMFCFAPPDTPGSSIPEGCLHPHYLLRRVVAGVKDYGNRMGIPTNNGSVHFHPDFRAKPSIIVGAYGMLPADSCGKGQPLPGDLGIVIGGRTGRDGIHGATFSSGEMTHRTVDVNSSAVQIGNAIEEKRMSDALLEASREGLIRAVTDCGAGGFSSALGEMGEKTGVRVWLERAPLKYPGLSPWEIWLSESQERMVLAVAPENLARLMEICRSYNVEATVLAEFSSDGRLLVTYNGETVCHLEMEFLHNGLPRRRMTAFYNRRPGVTAAKRDNVPGDQEPPEQDWPQIYKGIMSHLNVCSKEPIIRVYDHGVQGSCALPPLAGEKGDAPNDAVVLTPIPGQPCGVVISHGLNPVLNNIDPYYGSLWAAAEAAANAVAVGADPEELCLIDNFIWPFPDEEALGALDLAVDACVDFVRATGMPFISGKDSLSSTYRGADGSVLKIPPVLCVSAFGRIPDVGLTVSADFKRSGSRLVLVGGRDPGEMAGSAYYDLLDKESDNLPRIDPGELSRVLKSVHGAIRRGKVLACHDISEGGLAAAVAEMCFGGDMGASLTLPPGVTPGQFLFNETAGCFVVELDCRDEPREIFGDVPLADIGVTTPEKQVALYNDGSSIFRVELEELKAAWKRPMKEVFGA